MATAVLIVNYRNYADLDRCLDSLTRSVAGDDEVIVVDCESDASQLAHVAARYPRVVTIPHADNLGFAAGVNLAARRADAPLICLLNPDTVVDEGALATMSQWLAAHPAVSVVGPRVLNGDGTTQPSARRFPGWSTVFGGRSTWLTQHFPHNWVSRRNLLGLDSRDAVDVDWISGACLMTRRDTFTRLGGLDESFFLYWEDADYCRRIAADGGRCTYLPSVCVRHFANGSAKFDQPRAIRAFHRSAFRFYEKHGGGGALVTPLVRAGLYVRGELRLRQAMRAQRREIASAPAMSGDAARIALQSPTTPKRSLPTV
jgi:GT2 family glycosyltransferase